VILVYAVHTGIVFLCFTWCRFPKWWKKYFRTCPEWRK